MLDILFIDYTKHFYTKSFIFISFSVIHLKSCTSVLLRAYKHFFLLDNV